MNYTQYKDTSLFLPEGDDVSISCAWYYSSNNEKEGVPSKVSLNDSWMTYLGYYVFFQSPIDRSDEKGLDDLAAALLGDESIQKPAHTGAIWLTNAVQPLTILARIETLKQKEIVVLAATCNLGFGKYNLPLFEGAMVALNVENPKLEIGYPEVEGAQAAVPERGLKIALEGECSGVATGEVLINNFTSDPLTGWSIGLKYNKSSGGVRSQFYPVFNIESERYLLFGMSWDPRHPLDHTRTHLTFTGVSVSIRKVDGTKDQFELKPGEDQNRIPSFWRTVYGTSVDLRPVLTGQGVARLVFQTCYDPESSEMAYYLSPKGDFRLCVSGQSGKQLKLLCGLSGTESLVFTAGDKDDTGDILCFTPDQGAYTKDYPVVKQTTMERLSLALRADLTQGLLDTTYTTSWLSVRPDQGNPNVIYYSAAEAANLYEGSTRKGILNPFDAEAAQFTAADFDTTEICFPMVPYAGIEHKREGAFLPKDLQPFEMQIIGDVRRQIIADLPLSPPVQVKEAPTVTTTPQGLLATIQGTQWKSVLLAQNKETGQDFSFESLPNRLRNAFQTNELFLVASDARNLGTFKNSIGIEGWTFNVDVPTREAGADQKQDNILLLKFRKGSILELIQDVNAWTDAIGFNFDEDQVVSTQTWLIQYCNDALKMAKENDRYAHFARIIQDPDWYGVLSLKVDINLGIFPDDLKGLLGAMDLSRFDAHHVGVQINYIQSDETGTTSGISVKKSNLFALISYIDPGYKESLGSDSNGTSGPQEVITLPVKASSPAAIDPSLDQVTYAYKVLTLQISFANSAITNFESKLRLTARKWFDDPASLNPPKSASGVDSDPTTEPANYAMLFNGHYENHEGHKTYTFLTQKGTSYQYFMGGEIFHYVEFVKAQFSTVSSLKDGPESTLELVKGAFTFYGYLNFKALDGFDSFSYGSEDGDEQSKGKGLYFSNMAVDVSFRLDTEQSKTSDLSLVFNPKSMGFDQSLSTIRKASLGQGFPLSPSAILVGDGNGAPTQLGYVHVSPPTTFKSGGLGNEWYGLDLELHWGGPGALADQVGFIPHLLLAWSPGGTLSTEILIRLPGSSSGGKTLSLQNVLKLKVGTFRFDVVEQGTDQISYNLLLTSIALSVIGLKLPPAGSTNLALLGDPRQPGTMGWYGAYINKS